MFSACSQCLYFFFSATRLIVGRTKQQNELIWWRSGRWYLLLNGKVCCCWCCFHLRYTFTVFLDKIKVFYFPGQQKMAHSHTIDNILFYKGKVNSFHCFVTSHDKNWCVKPLWFYLLLGGVSNQSVNWLLRSFTPFVCCILSYMFVHLNICHRHDVSIAGNMQIAWLRLEKC